MRVTRYSLAGTVVVLLLLVAALFKPQNGHPSMPSSAQAEALSEPVLHRGYHFQYRSESLFHPPLNRLQEGGEPGLTIRCEAHGRWHVLHQGGFRSYGIEFETFSCNEQDLLVVHSKRGTWSESVLESEAAVREASQNPRLALARSLYLHALFPHPDNETVEEERRLEGIIRPSIFSQSAEAGRQPSTKSFTGRLPGPHDGLSHFLSLKVEVIRPTGSEQLLSLEGYERSETSQGHEPIAVSEVFTSLRPLEVSPAADDLVWLETVELLRDPSAAQPMTAEKKSALQRDWQSFLSGRGRDPAIGSVHESNPLYVGLKYGFRQDPSLIRDYADELGELDPHTAAFSLLTSALVYSGRTEALEILLAEQTKHDMKWHQAVTPLVGLAPRPTRQSWRYLDERRQTAERDQAEAAELGMATHLKHDEQSEDALRFREEILERLAKAQAESERLMLLDLIGNAGLDAALPTIRTWLPQASVTLLIRVAQSMRHMKSDEAARLVLSLVRDSRLEVRLAALETWQLREPREEAITVFLAQLERSSQEAEQLLLFESLYQAKGLDTQLLSKVQSIRSRLSLTPRVASQWESLEQDWMEEGT